MKFSVTVTLKKDVLDPQGKVIKNTLNDMGIKNLNNLRQGKYFEIEVNETNLTLFSTGYLQSLLTAIFSPCNCSLDWVTELHFQRFLLFICNNHTGQDRLS